MKYVTTWLFLEPLKGKPTKRDKKLVKHSSIVFNKYIAVHYSSLYEAENGLNNIPYLNKKYKAYFITDKQFGMMKNNVHEVLTEAQKQFAKDFNRLPINGLRVGSRVSFECDDFKSEYENGFIEKLHRFGEPLA